MSFSFGKSRSRASFKVDQASGGGDRQSHSSSIPAVGVDYRGSKVELSKMALRDPNLDQGHDQHSCETRYLRAIVEKHASDGGRRSNPAAFIASVPRGNGISTRTGCIRSGPVSQGSEQRLDASPREAVGLLGPSVRCPSCCYDSSSELKRIWSSSDVLRKYAEGIPISERLNNAFLG